MKRFLCSAVASLVVLVLVSGNGIAAQNSAPNLSEQERGCQALVDTPNLTITSARLREADGGTPDYCYVKGTIPPAIQYHVQLPLPQNWNGRFLKWGDGGTDGDLDFADERVAQGYAVANSNMGHDNGSEPGASFAFDNRQAEIDFGYRAAHLTANAGKTLVEAYYGKAPAYSYFEGCSTGGREALMEAQRFPFDFDGIVGGDPVHYLQSLNAMQLWMVQRFYRDGFAGNLAFDTDGDGAPDSLTKMKILEDAVLAKCDAGDGSNGGIKDRITDGVIGDPLACKFDPAVDLAAKMCPGNVDADNCFTTLQIQTIKTVYDGARDSKGVRVYKGYAPGSEPGWADQFIPMAENSLRPGQLDDFMNFLFYENDPGVPVPDITQVSAPANTKKKPPEWAWWEFSIDDVTAGKGEFMMEITDARDPDLRPFLVQNNGKLILYHGWRDSTAPPEPTVDYYKQVLATAFQGDAKAAQERFRLFMAPGMDHCRGGPGPNTWDKLGPLVDWVENGKAPDFLVATHSTNGVVDNERKLCPYPQHAVYTGPAGGENDRANWVQGNFTCR
jgi:feruloyl esterase